MANDPDPVPSVPSVPRPTDLISPVIRALDAESVLRVMVDAFDVSAAYAAFLSYFDDADQAHVVS